MEIFQYFNAYAQLAQWGLGINNNNRVDVDINYYHCCVVVIFPPSICRLYSDDER